MGLKHNDRCLEKVADNEPIFVLRAQDQSAPELIRRWIRDNLETLDPEHIAEAEQCARNMESWLHRRAPT